MKRSSWLAALVAPIAAPLVYTAAAVIFFPDPARYDERTLGAWFVSLLFYIPASYVACFIFGVPLIHILGRMGKLSFWSVTLLAIPLGASAFIAFLLISVFFGATVAWSGISSFVGVGGIVGFVVAAAYCALADVKVPSGGRSKAHRAG